MMIELSMKLQLRKFSSFKIISKKPFLVPLKFLRKIIHSAVAETAKGLFIFARKQLAQNMNRNSTAFYALNKESTSTTR